MINNLLREELGYSGVVVTDDLQMGAITNRINLAEMASGVIQAGGGNDNLILLQDDDKRDGADFVNILAADANAPFKVAVAHENAVIAVEDELADFMLAKIQPLTSRATTAHLWQISIRKQPSLEPAKLYLAESIN